MSQFVCKCGYLMKFRTGRERYDLQLLPQSNIEDVINILDREAIDGEKFIEIIDSNSFQVMRCPQCDRLWVESNSKDGLFHSYLKEN